MRIHAINSSGVLVNDNPSEVDIGAASVPPCDCGGDAATTVGPAVATVSVIGAGVAAAVVAAVVGGSGWVGGVGSVDDANGMDVLVEAPASCFAATGGGGGGIVCGPLAAVVVMVVGMVFVEDSPVVLVVVGASCTFTSTPPPGRFRKLMDAPRERISCTTILVVPVF